MRELDLIQSSFVAIFLNWIDSVRESQREDRLGKNMV